MTVREAKKRWAGRRRQYVVGYIDSGNLLFFSRFGLKPSRGHKGGVAIDPMTLLEARRFLYNMPCRGAAIFQVMPIAVGGGRA